MENQPFRIDFRVRDYECDLQGVVNNAVYMHYLSHARHEYIRSVGLDFAELHQKGIYSAVLVNGRPTPFEKAIGLESYRRLLGVAPQD